MTRKAADRDQEGLTQSGFTLAEALVAITLFSLLSLLVMNALGFGTKAWEKTNEASARLDETVQVQALLRHLLTEASPRFVPQPAGKGYVDFQGEAQSVSFISYPPRSLDDGGRLFIAIAADQAESRVDLVIKTKPELGTSETGPRVMKRALVSHIVSVRFSYFGAKQWGETARWHSSWVNERALPDLVRIEVEFPAGTAGLWPEIVVAPKIDVDVSCIYDSLTRGCRGR